jgi:sialic acid synthase SpsE
MSRFRVGNRWIGPEEPTFFVADIAANHDGRLERAKNLIRLAAEAGADAAKFQNFRAASIVSDYGFKALGSPLSHQAKWRKSVFDVYQAASLPWEWTEDLKTECQRAGIEYFSAPYDLEAVDMLDEHMALYKIGSGDISWPEMLERVASKGKPVILACGASTAEDVHRAVETILRLNKQIVLMQCNTNYTGSLENFKHVHLNVLTSFAAEYPGVVLGLSDHTPGHATVLGAVALGARVIEKHFTDDTRREGPDHSFSMEPRSWREMVDRTRELELALGCSRKGVAANEEDAVIIQRRCLRAAQALTKGTTLTRADIDVLRPAPHDGIFPYDLPKVVGLKLRRDVPLGERLTWTMLEE